MKATNRLTMSSDRKDVGIDDDTCQYPKEYSAYRCLGCALAYACEHNSDRGIFDCFAWISVLLTWVEDDQK